MYALLFKNRLAALGFVLLTAAGAVSLIGTEEDAGLIQQTKEQILAQKQGFADKVEGMQAKNAEPRPVIMGPTPEIPVYLNEEAETRDPTLGYDPTPIGRGEPLKVGDYETIIILDPPKAAETPDQRVGTGTSPE